MTAISDVSPHFSPSEPPRMANGDRMILRTAQRLAGAALVLAAMGLWIEPGSNWDTDLTLIKLGLSLVMGFAGLAMLQAGRSVSAVEVEIDTVRREVRLVRGKGRARTLVGRTKIADLGTAELRDNLVRLWAADGALVAEVALTDPDMRTSLVRALRDADKL